MRKRRAACAILFALYSVSLLCQSPAGKEPPVSYWHKVVTPDVLPVWIGGGAALIASIAAVISLLILRDQTKTGLLSAQAAEEGAKAALLSAKSQMDADRGWVLATVSGQPAEPLTGNLLNKGVRPGIVWKLQIAGNTPVRILRVDFRCRIVDSDPNMAFQPLLEPKPVYIRKNVPEGRVMYAPGDKPLQFSVILEDLENPQPNVTLMDRLAQIPIGAGFMVSYGRVEYEDAFKRKGVTQFCAIYKPHTGAVLQSPDGTVLNPVGFHIGGPAAYNYND